MLAKIITGGQTPEMFAFSGDDLQSSMHYTAKINTQIIGIATIISKPFPETDGESNTWYQLRGMAVKPEFQGTGVGRDLLKKCEEEAMNCGVRQMWSNARVEAAGFYLKWGYKTIGNAFMIPDVGLQRIMFKNLQSPD